MQLDNRVTFATPEGVALELVLAGLGSRFLARLLDTVIQGALIIALALGAAATHAPGWIDAFVFVFVFLVVFAYDVVMETLNNGRTFGKQAAGIRVLGQSGEPIRFVPSAVRNILRIIDFLPLFYLVGSVSIVLTERDQRLGDLAAGTIVDPRPVPRVADRAGGDHRRSRGGRDLGRLVGLHERGAGGAALPRPPARAARPGARVLRARPRRAADAEGGGHPAQQPPGVRARGDRRGQAGSQLARRARIVSSVESTATLELRNARSMRVIAAGLVGAAAVWPMLPVHPPFVVPAARAHRHPVPVLWDDARVCRRGTRPPRHVARVQSRRHARRDRGGRRVRSTAAPHTRPRYRCGAWSIAIGALWIWNIGFNPTFHQLIWLAASH